MLLLLLLTKTQAFFCLKSGKIMDLKLSYLIIEWMGFLNTDDRGINIFISLELY